MNKTPTEVFLLYDILTKDGTVLLKKGQHTAHTWISESQTTMFSLALTGVNGMHLNGPPEDAKKFGIHLVTIS